MWSWNSNMTLTPKTNCTSKRAFYLKHGFIPCVCSVNQNTETCISVLFWRTSMWKDHYKLWFLNEMRIFAILQFLWPHQTLVLSALPKCAKRKARQTLPWEILKRKCRAKEWKNTLIYYPTLLFIFKEFFVF